MVINVMTTVYLIRHSEKNRNVININNNDSFQLTNEKITLSVNGEKKANLLSYSSEMQDIESVFSSNYVRAVETAKYIAEKNNTNINIIEGFGERKYGIDSLDDIIENFEKKQLIDENYKLKNGESQKEVRDRMYNSLMYVIKNYREKRIAIVSHGTAMIFLLGKWCDISLVESIDNKLNTKIVFNDTPVFEGNLDAPEVFKLVFDENDNLTIIENIKWKE